MTYVVPKRSNVSLMNYQYTRSRKVSNLEETEDHGQLVIDFLNTKILHMYIQNKLVCRCILENLKIIT